jgi:hypothetical protein
MTRKRVILTLKAMLKHLVKTKLKADDVEEDDPDLESIAGSSS